MLPISYRVVSLILSETVGTGTDISATIGANLPIACYLTIAQRCREETISPLSLVDFGSDSEEDCRLDTEQLSQPLPNDSAPLALLEYKSLAGSHCFGLCVEFVRNGTLAAESLPNTKRTQASLLAQSRNQSSHRYLMRETTKAQRFHPYRYQYNAPVTDQSVSPRWESRGIEGKRALLQAVHAGQFTQENSIGEWHLDAFCKLDFTSLFSNTDHALILLTEQYETENSAKTQGHTMAMRRSDDGSVQLYDPGDRELAAIRHISSLAEFGPSVMQHLSSNRYAEGQRPQQILCSVVFWS